MSLNFPLLRPGQRIGLAWLVDVDRTAFDYGYPGGRLRASLNYTPVPEGHHCEVIKVERRSDPSTKRSWLTVTIRADVHVGQRKTGWRRLHRRRNFVGTAVIPTPWMEER